MKQSNLLVSFIKDQLGFMATYFTNTLLLLTFFYLYDSKIEFVYPIILSLFVFSVSSVIKWFKYWNFGKHLDLVASNALYQLKCGNNEHKRIRRTIEKIHTQYRQQISIMQIKDRDKRRLISQFIHAIKSPVTVIDMATATLMKDISQDSPALKDILMEKEKILNNLDNVLTILRLDEFESDYSPEVVNLEQSLRGIINNNRRNFVYGHVVPKIDIHCETPLVLTDTKWHTILLEQFISNGIKYSMAGDDMKTLLFMISKTNEKIILSIKDEGVGIPEYDISRISEPYFTGENGRKVKNSSGIGLHIAYKIAEKLGHKIEIMSQVNQGTEIKITYLTKS
ncbi:MAG: sensor histidine kinase [Vallitaleaceae bacterium]|nr:sensor histidine kinase [Vallitaleaceae bacterium]